ncbi:MAG: mycofactocin biosynthesis glycosyltransferase MftF [Bifidobacteriaceae bacterium]|nr:mycofactocin biosynthesis glycosyltransferase MftF [Bifidobacteriaceae bacterium]
MDTIIADAGRTVAGGWPRTVLFLAPGAARKLRPGPVSTVRVSDHLSAALAARLVDAGVAHLVLETLPGVAESDLTVVVPVKDRPRQLDRLLASLAGRLRVIVVDDASVAPAPVARICRAHGASLVSLTVNLGPGGARNAGLARVGTPYVAFVDSDVVVAPEDLLSLARHFADPQVALVGPRIAGLASTNPNAIELYEADRSSLDLGSMPALVRAFSPVSWMPAACLLARVDALGSGFEEDLRVGEDVDLVWRLVSSGHRVRYEPAVCVRHEHRTVIGPWLARKAEYGASAAQLALRHPGKVAPAVLAPWSAALVLALAAQRRWSVPVAAVCGLAAIVKVRRRLDRAGEPGLLALRLVASGARAALAQVAGLALRHWWPVSVVASVFSGRARRALAVVAMGEALVSWARSERRLGPFTFALLRRADHCAYGFGLWRGALREKSFRALAPISSRAHQRGGG